MTYQLITARTTYALTLQEAKDHLRITSSSYDDYINTLIAAVQDFVEEGYDLSLTQETFDLLLDEFPTESPYAIEIWKWPVSGITSVKYTDSDGNTQTVDSADYTTDTYSRVTRITPDDSWPTAKDIPNAVQVRFTTGFANPESIPEDLKLAMKLIIGDWYDNREDRGRRYTRVSERILYKYKY